MSRRSRKQPRVPDPPDGPPTVVSLEWDYMYPSVLTDRSPGVLGVDFVDPAELGLPADLRERLQSWLDRQEALSAAWIRDEPATEEEERARLQLRRELLTLAYDVRQELAPDVEVLLDGRTVEEQRRSW